MFKIIRYGLPMGVNCLANAVLSQIIHPLADHFFKIIRYSLPMGVNCLANAVLSQTIHPLADHFFIIIRYGLPMGVNCLANAVFCQNLHPLADHSLIGGLLMGVNMKFCCICRTLVKNSLSIWLLSGVILHP